MPQSRTLSIKQAISRAKKVTQQGDISTAIALYNAVLRQDPSHRLAKKQLDKLQKDFLKNPFRNNVTGDPPADQFDTLINLYYSGKLTEAERACKEMLQTHPESFKVINVLGAAFQGQGKSVEAINAYDKAIELNPNFPDAHNNRGSVLKELGRDEEALDSYNSAIKINPNYAEAYHNRGIVFKDRGRLEEAIDSYEKATLCKPDYAAAHSSKGLALKALGQLEQALQSYDKAIGFNPDYAEVYNNRGVVLQELGHPDRAVQSCDKAIQCRAGYSEAYYNRGISLKNLGKLEESIDSYEQAVKFNPDFSLAHYNLGNAFRELGRGRKAVASYDKAIQINEDYADAYSNLAITLKELGQIDEAINSSKKAVSIDPLNRFYWTVFADVLQGIKLRSYSDDLGQCLLQILEQPTISPKDVSQTVISALLHHPIVQHAQKLYECNSIEAEIDALTYQLSTVTLLVRIMELSPVSDIKLEKIFTIMRKVMLFKVANGPDDIQGFPFYVTLAMHCFTNEYIFSNSSEESEQVEALQTQVMWAFKKGKAVPPILIAILGTYKPLSAFSWAHYLMGIEWPIELQNLITRQVDNVKQEQSLSCEIPCLTPIKDGVSKLVRDQYEENPYPRWINAGLPEKGKSLTDILRDIHIRPDFVQEHFPDELDILVAGCGTGQHALTTATRFLNCNVLALDLSLSSLAYALRKTRELGIKNITYIQGDILELEELERSEGFDIIESVGVLHHMENPLLGWKALVDILRSGGLMKIGLYSNIARQHIVEARAQIAREKYTASSEDIRRYRKEILNMGRHPDSEISKVLDSSDFYSLSACRDLLFHVEEQRFTLPQIEQALRDLGLEFLGFELKLSNTRNKFKKLYPENNALSSLELWHQFELANPDTFGGMYQFWMCKI